jgi:hypothetical protein
MAYEKIFSIVSEIQFEPNQFLFEQYKKLLCYVIEVSIQIKKGKQLYSWANSTSQTGMVYLEKGGLLGERVFGYRFIDTYLTTRFLDLKSIKLIIINIMKEEKEIATFKEAENALSYNNIYMWWRLEDEEVINLLEKMRKELYENKYHPRYFKDILILLMQLRQSNFTQFNFSELCGEFVKYMKQRLQVICDEFAPENLEVLSDNKEFINEYNSIMKPIFDVLYKKDKEEKEKINQSFDLDKSWGNYFKTMCCENKSLYFNEHKFLYYINPQKMIKKINISTVEDIYSFLDGIKVVYSFSNLNVFFKDDIEHINEILKDLDIDILSGNKTTRRIVLEKLKSKLEESRDLIMKPYL